MEKYNKLIGAVVGNLVAIGILWLSFQIPAIAECAPAADPELPDVCTLLGMSQTDVTVAVMGAVNAFFVWAFPKNKPV